MTADSFRFGRPHTSAPAPPQGAYKEICICAFGGAAAWFMKGKNSHRGVSNGRLAGSSPAPLWRLAAGGAASAEQRSKFYTCYVRARRKAVIESVAENSVRAILIPAAPAMSRVPRNASVVLRMAARQSLVQYRRHKALSQTIYRYADSCAQVAPEWDGNKIIAHQNDALKMLPLGIYLPHDGRTERRTKRAFVFQGNVPGAAEAA